PQCDQNGDCGTMTGQSSFPHLQYIDWVAEIPFGFVEQHMSEPGTNDGGDDHINGEPVYQPFVMPLFLKDINDYLLGNNKAQGKKQTIPSQSLKAWENSGIGTPYHIC